MSFLRQFSVVALLALSGLFVLIFPATAMNGATSISSAASCSASTEGTFRYNSTNGGIEFCDGSSWKALSTSGSSSSSVTDAVSITGSSSCGSTTAGAIYYNSAAKSLRYCNGSSWVSLYSATASGSGTIGAAQIGHSACAGGTAGMVRYNAASGILELCGGSTWATFTTNPGAFSFTDQTGAATSSTISSNAVTLSGFFGSLTATCGTGCTAIARNGSWGGTSVSGFVSGDTIAIRQTSSGSGTTATTATVTVGNTTSGTWSVTTGNNNVYSTPGTYTYTVPAGVTQLNVKVWGAGGTGNSSGNAVWKAGGGAGGYGQATFSVSPGNTLAVVVGAGSSNRDASAGYSGVFLNNSVSQANAVVIAGGGGASGCCGDTSEYAGGGGGGGGTSGGNGASGGSGGGQGGTQSAAGSGYGTAAGPLSGGLGPGKGVAGGAGY
jgi:hypothetical protein